MKGEICIVMGPPSQRRRISDHDLIEAATAATAAGASAGKKRRVRRGPRAADDPKKEKGITDASVILASGADLVDMIWGLRPDSTLERKNVAADKLQSTGKIVCFGCGKSYIAHKGSFAKHVETNRTCLEERASGRKWSDSILLGLRSKKVNAKTVKLISSLTADITLLRAIGTVHLERGFYQTEVDRTCGGGASLPRTCALRSSCASTARGSRCSRRPWCRK